MKKMELFKALLKAFDTFFNEEEREVGCLTDEEHKEIMQMRNRIDDIFMQKLNHHSHEKEHKPEKEVLMYLPWLDDDDDAIEVHKKKCHQEMEL